MKDKERDIEDKLEACAEYDISFAELLSYMDKLGVPIWITPSGQFVYIIDGKVYTHCGFSLMDAEPDVIFGGQVQLIFGRNKPRQQASGSTHAIFFDKNNNIINIIGRDDCEEMWCEWMDYEYDRYIVIGSEAHDHRYAYGVVNRHCELVSDDWYDDVTVMDKRFAIVDKDYKHNVMNLISGDLISDEWLWNLYMYKALSSQGFAAAYKGRRMTGTLLNLTDGSFVNGWYDCFYVDCDDPDGIMIGFNFPRTDESGKEYMDAFRMTLPEFLEFAENDQ